MAGLTSPADHKPELDKYELLEEIGHGGMAIVYRAHDRRLGRDVAVKVIHRHLRENKEVAARFVSEARAVAKVKHRNIVEVYDVSDEEDEERYLVVELVRGTTLRKLVTAHGHMPAEIAAAIALELAAGLEHAHDQGVVHRDVKPENVLVANPGPISTRQSDERSQEAAAPVVKLTDFGIAKLLDVQGVTSTGQVLGSPAHMAPEQIEGGDVTARSDVFGLGVLLYECMVGKLPFDGKNPAQVLRRVLDGVFTPPDRARPTIGAEWSRIVSRALAHAPEERYESCGELSAAVKAELERVGFAEARRELGEYLADPERYEEAYEKRIVKRLAELGRRARDESEIAAAASAYNRALAFRPDDTDLLAQVAGLARRERMKKNAVRIAAVALVSVLFGGAAYGVARIWRGAPPPTSPEDSALVVSRKSQTRIQPEVVGRAEPQTATRPVQRKPPKNVQFVPGPPPVAKGGTRTVKVNLQGAKNSKVSFDGGPMRDPFNATFELTIGRHSLTVTPPNLECCVAPPPSTIEVTPGEGALEFHKKVLFKDATLQFSGPDGSKASCLTIGVELSGGSQKPVTMSEYNSVAKCNVSPPDTGEGTPKQIKTIDVTLTAGRLSTISWP
jgi:eukaryotic-like serine/threonine-protein kinase